MRRSSLVRGLSFLAWLPLAAAAQTQTAVFAGGCFWGVDAVFKHVKGVTRVVSGYSGGESSTAHYELVSEGTTGHAESVQVTFDPSVVPYSTLLKVFFAVAHDPTTLNRQGPDEGTQYRSAIFFANADQQRAAQAAIRSSRRTRRTGARSSRRWCRSGRSIPRKITIRTTSLITSRSRISCTTTCPRSST